MSASAKSIFVIFPHQLFRQLFSLPKDTVFCLIEDEVFFRDRTIAKGHVVSYRASMQALRERLLVKGYRVEYCDTVHYPDLATAIRWLKEEGWTGIRCFEPTLRGMEERLVSCTEAYHLTLSIEATPAYVTDKKWIETHVSDSMTFGAFYRIQRKRLGILLDESGRPQGGKWVLPGEKRKYKSEVGELLPGEFNRYIEDAILYVEEYAPELGGSLEPMLCAVTFADAEDSLEDLLERRLEDSECVYELLETGLLTPAQVLNRTMEYLSLHDIPLTELERFIRYLIGVREYDRAVALAR